MYCQEEVRNQVLAQSPVSTSPPPDDRRVQSGDPRGRRKQGAMSRGVKGVVLQTVIQTRILGVDSSQTLSIGRSRQEREELITVTKTISDSELEEDIPL